MAVLNDDLQPLMNEDRDDPNSRPQKSCYSISIFLFKCTPHFGALAYCIYNFIAENARVALLRCRYLNAVATVFMIISIAVMFKDIKHWRRNSESAAGDPQHISKTVVVFILGLAIITGAGYLKMISTFIVLYKYDIALDYIYPYEVIIDIVYCVFFILFLASVLCYVIIFAPFYETKELKTYWMYETLTINEHICQELLQESLQCLNRNGTEPFFNSLENLTVRERHLYDSLIIESPYIFTCTMELLPAIAAVLILLQRRRHKKAENKEFRGCSISNRKKEIAYGLLTVDTVLVAAIPIGVPLLCLFYDDHHDQLKTDWALFGHGVYRLIVYTLGLCLFVIVWRSYRKQPTQANIQQQNNADQEAGTGALRQHNPNQEASSPWYKEILDIPDLAIMGMAIGFTLVLESLDFAADLCAYFFYYTPMSTPAISQVIIHDAANFMRIFSFIAQFSVLRIFLTLKDDAFQTLKEDKFVVHLAPAALMIDVLRFGGIYLTNSNYVAPYDTKSDIWNDVLSMLDSAYPFSLMFSMTAALCWAHIIERLYTAGAYRVGSTTVPAH